MDWNPAFFDSILKSAGVEQLTKEAAERAYANAHASAPVKTGDYQRGLAIEREVKQYRTVYRLVGRDWKTKIIEARLGILVRALKAAKQ